MSRVAIASLMLALVVAAAGCRMCASPYDYCSPTFGGQCGEPCSPTARSGSILSGSVAPTPTDQQLLSQAIPHDEEIASGVILSVTDRKVDQTEGEEADVRASDLEPIPFPEEQLTNAGRPPQSSTWTATKPADTRAR